MRLIALVALCIAAVAAVPHQNRIVGGSVTTIGNYPDMAAMLFTLNWSTYFQSCGGVILTNRSILTAGHCLHGDAVGRWRVRLGSTNANSGGIVYTAAAHIMHPNYVHSTLNNDVAIMRLASTINFNNNVRAAAIAGANYNLGDNQVVWATGWGRTSVSGPSSEQLRHVQVWTVNQQVCAQRYRTAPRPATINPNMLCSGWLDVGGRDQCQGDSGGPLYHNRVVVGVCSFGEGCADARWPGVSARVTFFSNWIRANG